MRQFNPPRGQKAEFTWLKKDWPKALRVVGKYYGGLARERRGADREGGGARAKSRVPLAEEGLAEGAARGGEILRRMSARTASGEQGRGRPELAVRLL